MPLIKCPYLTHLTVQQIRSSASTILNAGANTCPVFAQWIRRSTSNSMTFEQLKSVHENLNREIHLAAECEDVHCPFLKSSSIPLRRLSIDEDAIVISRKPGKRRFSKLDECIPSGFSSGYETSFSYEKFFAEQIQAKKRDNSYRIFKRIERKEGLFPCANEKLNNDQSRSITVWCSNDYLGLSQHPKLKHAVM